MKLEIFILDKNNRKVSIKSGEMIVGFTKFKEDVYKATDPQVISGKRKVGEFKPRYGLVLHIHNENNINIIFASNALGKKFPAENKKGNKIYRFRAKTIIYGDPQKGKIILEKCSGNYQLKAPELVLNEILSSSYYLRFAKKKEKRLKIKENTLEM